VARALTGAGTFEEALQGYLKLKALMAIGKSPSTWRGEQPEGGWSYVLHRGLGEVRERQGLLRPATTSYLNAVKALGQDASVADWRARAWLDAARCLVAIDQRKAAISMLSEILPELAPAEFAGMRALVKATLAQIYMDDSERDWAVTLLEEIRSDPQLDAQQFAAAEARAEGRAWKEVVTGRIRIACRLAAQWSKPLRRQSLRMDHGMVQFGGRPLQDHEPLGALERSPDHAS
jgi:tetratricopeptide (TPR) repeat protein